ncbi:MAG: MbnP family protein [Luteibaculaceae bacterium]
MRNYIAKLKISLFVVFSLVFSACQEDKLQDPIIEENTGSLNLIFELRLDGNQYAMRTTESLNDFLVRIDIVKFYLGDIELGNAANEFIKISDVLFFEMGDRDERNLVGNIPIGLYNKIRFNVGVPARLNGSPDPDNEFNLAKFPREHPLSSFRNMYWTWATAYRFVIFEGRSNAENPSNSQLLTNLVFHPGTNPLLTDRTIEISPIEIASGETTALNFTIDIKDVLLSANDPFNLATENITHTVGNVPLAERFMVNFTNAITAANAIE